MICHQSDYSKVFVLCSSMLLSHGVPVQCVVHVLQLFVVAVI